MKHSLILTLLVYFMFSCNQKPTKTQPESIEMKIKKEAVNLAKEYASKQLKNPTSNTDAFGVINLFDEVKRYKIDPAKIFIGPINADNSEDALVTLASSYKHDLGMSEQIILLNNNGTLVLDKVFELDMKVVKLKDRIITGELHTKPRTSPLYNCGHCIEIANYQYQNGDLIRLK